MNQTLDKWRSQCPEGFDWRVKIDLIANGHEHTRYAGTCKPDVTEDDIARLFCHPCFGGRAIEVRGGRFSVIRHND